MVTNQKCSNLHRLQTMADSMMLNARVSVLQNPSRLAEFRCLYAGDLACNYMDSRTGVGGERPNGAPSTAYITATEAMFAPVLALLGEFGLSLSASPNDRPRLLELGISGVAGLRELFPVSREFRVTEDPFPVHNRVFAGDIVFVPGQKDNTGEKSEALAQFMLSVPHGHGQEFWLGIPKLQITAFDVQM